MNRMLTVAEAERMMMLAEEASEVVKACTKILRHGYMSYNPDNPEAGTNIKQLENELLDMWTIMERMHYHHDIGRLDYNSTGQVWKRKLKYTYHQPPFHDPYDPPIKP